MSVEATVDQTVVLQCRALETEGGKGNLISSWHEKCTKNVHLVTFHQYYRLRRL